LAFSTHSAPEEKSRVSRAGRFGSGGSINRKRGAVQ
jgi:hypothetical protein